mmetsp:Transcript_33156/g.98698  ORF Transcript_33156/g.98698 Transcript_33156/m.98698 type:complete len:249 (-) Transcript_33156:2435-3181(-)
MGDVRRGSGARRRRRAGRPRAASRARGNRRGRARGGQTARPAAAALGSVAPRGPAADARSAKRRHLVGDQLGGRRRLHGDAVPPVARAKLGHRTARALIACVVAAAARVRQGGAGCDVASPGRRIACGRRAVVWPQGRERVHAAGRCVAPPLFCGRRTQHGPGARALSAGSRRTRRRAGRAVVGRINVVHVFHVVDGRARQRQRPRGQHASQGRRRQRRGRRRNQQRRATRRPGQRWQLWCRGARAGI